MNCLQHNNFISLEDLADILGTHEFSIMTKVVEENFPAPIIVDHDGLSLIGFSLEEAMEWHENHPDSFYK